MTINKLAPKLYSWASILEDNTRDQAITASKMPFIYPHLALMPDAHLGKGATVGSVIPTLGAIIPAAVGVDIGCGMIAVRTQFTEGDLDGLDRTLLREAIEFVIPMSAGKYRDKLSDTAKVRIDDLERLAHQYEFNPDDYAANWRQHLGTLGSGNHFVEVSIDEEQRVWLFLHSGSRGIGNKIAQHHIKVAQEYARKNWIMLPDPDLAYLVEGTPEFDQYIYQLEWAQEFALQNREEMMDQLIGQFERWQAPRNGVAVEVDERVNCHHNYTVRETIFGKHVWLSRKGAIAAHEGTPGIIPGSMGTRSYIVEGKGNPMSLNSSPHGAGRNFSRSAARKAFTFSQLEKAMEGIEYRHTEAFIDEIPQAYKDIDVIMDDAKDLVTIKHTLRQIINCKGD